MSKIVGFGRIVFRPKLFGARYKSEVSLAFGLYLLDTWPKCRYLTRPSQVGVRSDRPFSSRPRSINVKFRFVDSLVWGKGLIRYLYALIRCIFKLMWATESVIHCEKKVIHLWTPNDSEVDSRFIHLTTSKETPMYHGTIQLTYI